MPSTEDSVAPRTTYQRDWAYRRKYGLSTEEYEKMLAAQGCVCAICLCPETANGYQGQTKRLAVDHNADTGQVRALLCFACNTGIGAFQHSTSLLGKAMQYMIEHENNSPGDS